MIESMRDVAMEFGLTEAQEWRFTSNGRRVEPPEDSRRENLFGSRSGRKKEAVRQVCRRFSDCQSGRTASAD